MKPLVSRAQRSLLPLLRLRSGWNFNNSCISNFTSGISFSFSTSSNSDAGKNSEAYAKAALGRRQQHDVDISTLSVLLAKRHGDKRSIDEIIEIPVSDQMELVQQLVHQQIIDIFCEIESLDNNDTQSQLAATSMEVVENNNSNNNVRQSETLINPDSLCERLADKNSLGFCVAVGKSTIDHEEAGEGLFATGEIKRGSVVAIYPGRVYMPYQFASIHKEFLQHQGSDSDPKDLSDTAREYTSIFGTKDEPNMAKIQRYDGVIINATRDGASRLNPFAFGHKINHPPAGVAPNLMVCPYDFPPVDRNISGVADMEEREMDPFQMAVHRFMRLFTSLGNRKSGSTPLKLSPYIPNKYWEKPHLLSYDLEVEVQSLVLVATRDISNNEELFVNYRFNPEMELPKWYHPVDSNEDRRRWGL